MPSSYPAVHDIELIAIAAILAAFPEPPFKDRVRYVAVGNQDSVQFPEHVSLVLDCLPFAISTFAMRANLSSIQWFRVATKPPETVGAETPIVNNVTVANVFLMDNKERLFLQELSIATGGQVGTEAAYKCQVCRNVPPEPLLCANTTTVVNAEGEWPHLTCKVKKPLWLGTDMTNHD